MVAIFLNYVWNSVIDVKISDWWVETLSIAIDATILTSLLKLHSRLSYSVNVWALHCGVQLSSSFWNNMTISIYFWCFVSSHTAWGYSEGVPLRPPGPLARQECCSLIEPARDHHYRRLKNNNFDRLYRSTWAIRFATETIIHSEFFKQKFDMKGVY